MFGRRMRQMIFVAVLTIAASGGSVGSALAATVTVGKPAAAFRLEALAGGNIDSSRLHGRPVLLNFFASWCPPCKLELPYIVRAYPLYASRVAFVGVDEQESATIVSAFARREHISYEIGIDEGRAAADFGVGAIPVSVFIDRGGIVRAINRGYLTPTLLRQDLALIAGH
jgi:cytochrome c biogenesis protein CcmG, thiol:disulfide interchange protein DsbE